MPTDVGIVPAGFDGAKFARLYGIADPAAFWVDGGRLFVRDGVTLPALPVLETVDPPDVQRRARAKEALTSTTDPTLVAIRNALRVVMGSLVETRTAVNALIARHNLLNPTVPITPLPNRAWPDVLAATRGRIDAETDPTT